MGDHLVLRIRLGRCASTHHGLHNLLLSSHSKLLPLLVCWRGLNNWKTPILGSSAISYYSQLGACFPRSSWELLGIAMSCSRGILLASWAWLSFLAGGHLFVDLRGCPFPEFDRFSVMDGAISAWALGQKLLPSRPPAFLLRSPLCGYLAGSSPYLSSGLSLFGPTTVSRVGLASLAKLSESLGSSSGYFQPSENSCWSPTGTQQKIPRRSVKVTQKVAQKRIFQGNNHHLVMPSRNPSISFIAPGRSSGLHLVSSQSCCM